MDEVAIDQIKPSLYQLRLNFKTEDLKEEIRKDGLLTPLIVRRKNDYYELIDGQRRLETLKELGWKKVPVEIQEVDDQKARLMVYKLNSIRESYSTEEKARYFEKLHKEGMTAYAIGQEFHIYDDTIRAYLNIFKFPEDIQRSIFDGRPSIGQIQDMESSINEDMEFAIKFARQIITQDLKETESRKLLRPYREERERMRIEEAKKRIGEYSPKANLETPEDLEKVAETLRKEARKKREETLTPTEKAQIEVKKRQREEESRQRELERKRREKEELGKRLETERKQIEEEAKKKAKEELLGDTEFLKQASRRVPFILAEEKLEEMQVELPSELTEELLPSKPPLGEEVNKLNTLNGNEWIKFTKTWFIHNPPPRKLGEMLHPAKFPETLIAEFIEFFTKHSQIVLDPLLGTGSTLVACDMTGRIGIGVELEEKWAKIAKTRTKQTVILGDARDIDKMKIPKVDFVITSPPYWSQLKRASIRQKERSDLGIPTEYSEDTRNIGNIDDYHKFIEEQKHIFEKVYDLVKTGGYLVIITNNVFFEGRLYPLAFDTAISLSRNGRWVLKDEKIWLQDNKELLPLGIYNAWVGNRCHAYCLIFRKEA
jgi:ParB/RepB/Spo0J family partition protein